MGFFGAAGFHPRSSSGGGLASIADLGNILFVSINGSNATGLKGRIDKPFQTINAAKVAASAGDTIYVFPGTFTESGIQADGLNYYFERGAIVENTGVIWDATSVPANIVVRGWGQFISDDSDCIAMTTPCSFDIECDLVHGNINGVNNGDGYIRLKSILVTNDIQYGIAFYGTSSADIFVNRLENLTGVCGVYVYNHSLDLVPRTLNLNIDIMFSNGSTHFGSFTLNNTFNCIVNYTGNIFHYYSMTPDTVFLDAGITVLNGCNLVYKGNVTASDGAYGLAVYGNFGAAQDNNIITFIDSLINSASLGTAFVGGNMAMKVNNPNTYVKLVNTQIYAKPIAGFFPTTIAQGCTITFGDDDGGNIQMYSCRINNTDTISLGSNCITKDNLTSVLILDDVVFLNSNQPFGGLSLFSNLVTGAGTVQYQVTGGGATGNAAVDPKFINTITGTTFIFDAGLPILPDNQ